MASINEKKFWENLLKRILKIILKNLGIRTTPPTHNQHVVPHEEGWAIKGAGNDRYTAIYETQREAIQRAKIIARNYESTVIIHRTDGTIRDTISYKED